MGYFVVFCAAIGFLISGLAGAAVGFLVAFVILFLVGLAAKVFV